MNRYNIFYQIHKGLRELLYNTASLLQQTDFTNTTEAAYAVEQVEEVLFLFDKHAHTEDQFILPAIERHEPAVASLFEEEHVQDHELSNRMRSLLRVYNHTGSPREKWVTAGAIRYAFIEFMIFNLQHMSKEEMKLNKLLWVYYTDDSLKEITQNILSQINPDVMVRYSTWMMKALSNSEIVEWLKEVKNSAPEFVFNSLLDIAGKALPVKRWVQVQEHISEGAMLA